MHNINPINIILPSRKKFTLKIIVFIIQIYLNLFFGSFL